MATLIFKYSSSVMITLDDECSLICTTPSKPKNLVNAAPSSITIKDTCSIML